MPADDERVNTDSPQGREPSTGPLLKLVASRAATLPLYRKRLLRLKQAAEYLGVGKNSILSFTWRQTDNLPFVQFSERGPLLFDVQDLDAWITAHKKRF